MTDSVVSGWEREGGGGRERNNGGSRRGGRVRRRGMGSWMRVKNELFCFQLRMGDSAS
jgi:hypothetical protein